MCCYRLRPCLCADLCDNKFGKDFEQVVANLCGQPCSLLPIYHGRCFPQSKSVEIWLKLFSKTLKVLFMVKHFMKPSAAHSKATFFGELDIVINA